MHEIIEQAGIDIQYLIDYFKNKEQIDADRIGVSGFSMGGYASFYVAANNPAIKAAVPVAGKPALRRHGKIALHQLLLMNNGRYRFKT